MQMMLPKCWKTIDFFNNLNDAPEILSNIICLAKHFLLNRSQEGFDHPINCIITNSASPQPCCRNQGCSSIPESEPSFLALLYLPLGGHFASKQSLLS